MFWHVGVPHHDGRYFSHLRLPERGMFALRVLANAAMPDIAYRDVGTKRTFTNSERATTMGTSEDLHGTQR
jgi:hypothetical protein